ncbi:MAG: aminodeoxychorismate synthase component I [Opitutaceae bacterium]|jgi:para-aminobenzoate synthetase component 1
MMIVKEIQQAIVPHELFGALHDRAGSFFLDSAQWAGGLGAYSFIGFDPFLTFRAKGNRISVSLDCKESSYSGDSLLELRRLLRQYRSPAHPKLPFSGGAVGYFSYELCSQLEGIPRTSVDDLDIPDLEFSFYEGIIACDLASQRSYLVANPVRGTSAEAIIERLEGVVAVALGRLGGERWKPAGPVAAETPRPNFTKQEYLQAVERVRDYIRSGDVYQVNLTQRFEAPLTSSPYDLYRNLRERSPASFACYLNLGSHQIVGSSPERFLSIKDGRVETRPIKGTRPRGRTPEEDAQLRNELATSAKDRAELLMIVDLERNDLGRVCEFGSIRVDEIFRLESYATVHHLVATITGQLRSGCDVIDCIRAAFPGGSITGAPKIRAMQIIDELETRRRYGYTGAVGYLGFDGNCDLNIAIRTIFCLDGRATYHVGGGIVWDSDPEREYQETLDKGRAMHAVLTGFERRPATP